MAAIMMMRVSVPFFSNGRRYRIGGLGRFGRTFLRNHEVFFSLFRLSNFVDDNIYFKIYFLYLVP
jgi:hypothetical protein